MSAITPQLRQFLAERERGADVWRAARRRELLADVLLPRKHAFLAAFRLAQRYHSGQRLAPTDYAMAEAMWLASDPGWDAERAWNYSETRRQGLVELSALERRDD